jgi:methionyl-tRNA formyltransferase
MAYTQDGIMAQIWIAFGQGTGAIRVSQEAALELHRWYFNAITPQVIDVEWETQAIQVLDRIRAIGSLAALKATSAGATAITPIEVFESATAVQETSLTDLCPPAPSPPA